MQLFIEQTLQNTINKIHLHNQTTHGRQTATTDDKEQQQQQKLLEANWEKLIFFKQIQLNKKKHFVLKMKKKQC